MCLGIFFLSRRIERRCKSLLIGSMAKAGSVWILASVGKGKLTALGAKLLPFMSKGSSTVRAKWVRSSMLFLNVRYCMFLVVNSSNGDE